MYKNLKIKKIKANNLKEKRAQGMNRKFARGMKMANKMFNLTSNQV